MNGKVSCETGWTSQHPVRVFLVEDSAILRDRVIEAISEPGEIEVVGYADSEDQAIAQVVNTQPDVMIVDIQLHKGTGINVLGAVRRLKLPTSPKAIVLTNHATPEYMKQCMQLGADYFFDKSSQLPRVWEVLKQLASRH